MSGYIIRLPVIKEVKESYLNAAFASYICSLDEAKKILDYLLAPITALTEETSTTAELANLLYEGTIAASQAGHTKAKGVAFLLIRVLLFDYYHNHEQVIDDLLMRYKALIEDQDAEHV